MSPLVVLVVVAFLVAAWRTEPEPDPFACTGETQPVDEETLIRTLDRFGFELQREDFCEGVTYEPSAMFTDTTAEEWLDALVSGDLASLTEVSCDLWDGRRFGADVTRLPDSGYVAIRVLNVDCSIDAADASRVERLDEAVHQLAREG